MSTYRVHRYDTFAGAVEYSELNTAISAARLLTHTQRYYWGEISAYVVTESYAPSVQLWSPTDAHDGDRWDLPGSSAGVTDDGTEWQSYRYDGPDA